MSGAACVCPAGQYASSNVCVVCASGSVTDTLTLAGASSCTPCVAGKYSTSSQVACQACAAGTYSMLAGSTSCASYIFSYTGSVQTWLVPAYVASFTIEAYGAAGSDYIAYEYVYIGGKGGYISVTNIPASSFIGQTLFIYVGGQGAYYGTFGGTTVAGGFNGGGTRAANDYGFYWTGGGATDLRTSSSDLNTR